MLAVIFLAGTVHSAFDTGSIGFVSAYVTIRSIVLVMYFRTTHYVSASKANFRVYLASYVPSTLLWLTSIACPAPIKFWLWGIAMTIELLVPILGTRVLAKTPAHPSHLQERFGLFTLIVLGESIVSVATTANRSWVLLPTIAAIVGFGVAACLWWLYFNFLETAVVIRGIGSVHAFNYGHFPIVMGLSLVAVGTEQTILEAATHGVLSAGARWALLGGVALYMSAIAFITVAACRRRFSWQMVIAISLVLGLAIFGHTLSPIVLEGLLFTLLLAKVSLQVLTTQPVREAEQVAIEFGDSSQ